MSCLPSAYKNTEVLCSNLQKENEKYLSNKEASAKLAKNIDGVVNSTWPVKNKSKRQIVTNMLENKESFLNIWKFLCEYF